MPEESGTHGRSKGAGLLASLAFFLVPATAHAACDLAIEPVRTQVILRFNPLEANGSRDTIEVRVVNRGDTACTGSLSTSLNGEQFGLRSDTASQSIAYQLVDERSQADITPRSGDSLTNAIKPTINLAPGEHSMEQISFYVLPVERIGRGLYTQQVNLSVQDPAGSSMAIRPLTLGIEVPASAVIGIKGQVARARGAAVVELGELTPGRKDLPLTVYVNSTGGYRVSVSSENEGRLKLEDAPWFVAYKLRMGNYQLRLTGPDGFEVASQEARYDDYPLTVEIGETEGKRAGNYRDTVTFTIASI